MPDLAFQAGQPFLGGEYRLTKKIGEGGMSQVWEAVEIYSGNAVAIKMLHDQGPGFAERFRRESLFYTKLRHPNVVRMLRAGETIADEGAVMYIVMDRLEGITLRDTLGRARRVDLRDALHLVMQLADTMGYVHGKGIWHRDLKPENLLVGTLGDARGHLWLLDFGISKFADPSAMGLKSSDGLPDVATCRYMSPEQALDRRSVDGRSDVYAFGLIFYEMLAGRHAIVDDRSPMSAPAMVRAHLAGAIVPLTDRRPDLPESAWRVVERCVAREPERRYQTFDEVKQALRGLVRKTLPPDHVLAKQLDEHAMRAERIAAFDRVLGAAALDGGIGAGDVPAAAREEGTRPLAEGFAAGAALPFAARAQEAKGGKGRGYTERMAAVPDGAAPVRPTIDERAAQGERAAMLPAATGGAARAAQGSVRPAVEEPLRPTAPMSVAAPRRGRVRVIVVVAASVVVVAAAVIGVLVLRDGDGADGPAAAASGSATASAKGAPKAPASAAKGAPAARGRPPGR